MAVTRTNVQNVKTICFVFVRKLNLKYWFFLFLLYSDNFIELTVIITNNAKFQNEFAISKKKNFHNTQNTYKLKICIVL